jgi:hypothetical protein
MQWLIPRKQLGSRTFYKRNVEYEFDWDKGEYRCDREVGAYRTLATNGHAIYVYDETHVSCVFANDRTKRVVDSHYSFNNEWSQIILPHAAFARIVINDPAFDPSDSKYSDMLRVVHNRVVRSVANSVDTLCSIYEHPHPDVVLNPDGTLADIVPRKDITIFTPLGWVDGSK